MQGIVRINFFNYQCGLSLFGRTGRYGKILVAYGDIAEIRKQKRKVSLQTIRQQRSFKKRQYPEVFTQGPYRVDDAVGKGMGFIQQLDGFQAFAPMGQHNPAVKHSLPVFLDNQPDTAFFIRKPKTVHAVIHEIVTLPQGPEQIIVFAQINLSIGFIPVYPETVLLSDIFNGFQHLTGGTGEIFMAGADLRPLFIDHTKVCTIDVEFELEKDRLRGFVSGERGRVRFSFSKMSVVVSFIARPCRAGYRFVICVTSVPHITTNPLLKRKRLCSFSFLDFQNFTLDADNNLGQRDGRT